MNRAFHPLLTEMRGGITKKVGAILGRTSSASSLTGRALSEGAELAAQKADKVAQFVIDVGPQRNCVSDFFHDKLLIPLAHAMNGYGNAAGRHLQSGCNLRVIAVFGALRQKLF